MHSEDSAVTNTVVSQGALGNYCIQNRLYSSTMSSVNSEVLSSAYAYSKTYEQTEVLQCSTHKFRHQKPHGNRKHKA